MLFTLPLQIITYSDSNYKGISEGGIVGVSIGILAIWTILNCIRIDYMGFISGFAAICQLGSVIFISIVLLVKATKFQSASFVFTHYNNLTGFSSPSYVGAISLLTVLWSTSGYEACAHLSEETHGARKHAPRGVLSTCLATGLSGFLLLIVMLFTTVDFTAVLGENDDDGSYVHSGNAGLELFRIVGGEFYGIVIAWLVVINTFFAGMTSVGVTGRIIFALARDGALPYSHLIAKVHSKFRSPVNAIFTIFFIDALLQLLPLVSSQAFYNLTGMSTIGFQVSYAIPIFLKLIFHHENYKNEVHIPSTPYSLGSWSKPFGLISSLWLMVTSCILFFPTLNPVTVDNMNWSVVIVGGVVVIAASYWVLHARISYKGPVRLIDAKKVIGSVETDDVIQLADVPLEL